MSCKNPLYMAEQAAMVDLISGNERLQLGISRGSPETVYKGFAHFGYLPADGEDEAVAEADTLMVTIPNMLGVDFNLRQLEAIVQEIKPALK